MQSIIFDKNGNRSEETKGIVDTEGKIVIEVKYDQLTDNFDDGYIVCDTRDHSDVYNKRMSLS